MSLALEVYTRHLLNMEEEWPALADMRDDATWSFPWYYREYGRTLLATTLLYRAREVPAMRLTLQKARAMHCAGIAHLYHKELICMQPYSFVRSCLWMGPNFGLGETPHNFYPTEVEEARFYDDAPRSSDSETESESES
jgi:hypothetical protein